ncbi:MAG: glycosyltransferase family 39 protein [Pseudomonadota bacterium]
MTPSSELDDNGFVANAPPSATSRGGLPAPLVSGLGVVFFFMLYGCLHGLATRAAGPALALDDVKLNIVTQSFQRGYMPENPPLFEWLLLLVQSAVGPTLLSFIIVKYALLTVAGVFTYFAARDVFDDRPWAALTAGALILFYQLGWNYHQAFTHSAALIACVAIFWRMLFATMKRGRLVDYVGLGVALGLGALSKYSFVAVAPIAFAAAALAAPAFRRALVAPKIIASFVVAFLVAAPHILWLATENADVAASAAARLQGEAAPYGERVAKGAPHALWAIVSYFLIASPVAAVVFGAQSLDLRVSLRDASACVRTAAWATLGGAGGLIAVVFLLGMDSMQERYAIPFLFPCVFALMAAAKANATPSRIRTFASVIGMVMLAGVGLRGVEAARAGAPFCEKCRQWIPYDPLAAAIAENGFETYTLVGYDDHIAGNLRRLFPESRVLSMHMPFYTPPLYRSGAGSGAELCVLIWSPDLAAPPPALIKRFDPQKSLRVAAPWRHPLKEDGWRMTEWRLEPLTRDSRLAKRLCRL